MSKKRVSVAAIANEPASSSSTAPLADVAGLLRRFRLRAGLTQEALSEASGISVAAINTLEGRRRRAPRPETISAFAKALDLSPGDRQLLELAARQAAAQQAAITSRNAVPRDLPPAIADFTGRDRQLGDLLRLLRDPYVVAPSIVVSAVSGMGGVGKTTLALQAGWLTSEDFPDGQLYINLRGGTDRPLDPADALRQLLQPLGVRLTGDADDLQVLAGRYRTALAGRRALILLDDAASVDQVRPLLPGAAGVAVVITSRERLSALPGVRHVDLDVLTESEAVQLLGEVVGPRLIARDPESAREIVARCGYLPLAIRIAGGQCHRSPTALRELGTLLADDSLAALTEVHRSISLSLTALASGNDLDRAAAKAFPALTLFDGDHFPHRAAARVLNASLAGTDSLLERLVDANLLQTTAPHVYKFHDLVRELGRRSTAELTDIELTELRIRELHCYRGMLWRYDELTGNNRDPYQAFVHPSWSADAAEISDPSRILSWLDVELQNLVRLAHAAATRDEDEQLVAVQLALGMPGLALDLLRFAEPYRALVAIANSSIKMNLRYRQGLYYWTGSLCADLGFEADGARWLLSALQLARELDEPDQLAATLLDLAYTLARSGRPVEAMQFAEEGSALAKGKGIARLEMPIDITIGVVSGALGDLDRQRAMFERALELLRSQAPTPIIIFHLHTLAQSLVDSGQYQMARAILTDALNRSKAGRPVAIEADLLLEVGRSWAGTGNWELAAEAYSEGVEVSMQFPREGKEAGLLHRLGCAWERLGDVDAAREAWGRALGLFDRVADPRADEVRKLLDGDGVGHRVN
jgi:tetratricopeptide (TPR) repeat protein